MVPDALDVPLDGGINLCILNNALCYTKKAVVVALSRPATSRQVVLANGYFEAGEPLQNRRDARRMNLLD